MQARWLTVGAAAALLAGAACRPVDACARSGNACGGDPVGRWTLASACQDPAYKPPLQRTFLGQPTTEARQPPPDPSTSDWCDDLKYTASGIEALNLPKDTPSLIGAYIVYSNDNTYSAFVTSSARTSVEFSSSCLTRFGYSSSCADFGVAFAKYGATLGGVKDTSCEDSANGCLCRYTTESDAAGSTLNGTWAASGSVLTHFAGTMVLPTQVDFCVEGDKMTFWGHDRTNILDIAGARTLDLNRIVCGNGVVERGEDCEPPNTATCDAQCHAIKAPSP
jgi:hypothetical protein